MYSICIAICTPHTHTHAPCLCMNAQKCMLMDRHTQNVPHDILPVHNNYVYNACTHTHTHSYMYTLIHTLTQSTPPFVPQTGRSMRVPRETSIEYRNNIVKIKYEGKTLRIFTRIRKFIFWTGFKGTRRFRKNAPSNFIYGGGISKLMLTLKHMTGKN